MSTRTIRIPKALHRDFAVEGGTRVDGAEGEASVYPLTFSSELPVRRWSWDGQYDEILSHDAADVDLSRAATGLPLLKSHSRMDQIGSVQDIAIDGRRKMLRGNAGFSSITPARDQETLLREGHLKTVSIGYQVTQMDMVKKDKDGVPTYRCRWMPMEVSTEPTPADHKVGFGRGEDAKDLIEFEVEEMEERVMPNLTDPTGAALGTQPTPAQANQTRNDPGANTPPAPISGGRDRGAEATEIVEMAQRHGMGDRAADWLRKGLSPDQVRLEMLALMPQSRGTSQPASEALDAMPRKDRMRYSMQRAIRQQMEVRDGKRGSYDGLEAEVHQELSKNRGGTDHGGILAPWRLRDDVDSRLRTLGTTEPTGGATLVSQQVMPDMIDLLRNKALCLVAGARLYPGLQGVVWFNKKSSSPTVTWMAENPAAGVTATEPAYGYVTLSPKTLIGQVQIPRQLLVTASIDVEADVRDDLAIGHALALDLAALHGTGTDKQPVGIYSAADVQYLGSIAVPDLTDLTTMACMLADKNADLGALSWMTTPLLAGVLTRTPVVSGQTPMLWSGTLQNGNILGYPARATSQMSKVLGAGLNEHGLIFGNWQDLLIGMWGNELEIVVDVVTKAGSGQILITSYSMSDIAIRQPLSFVKGVAATLTA